MSLPRRLPKVVSPWQIRLRALDVIPRDGGSVGVIAGSGLSCSDSITPEIDITYYFTDKIAAEPILGKTKATVQTAGSVAMLEGRLGLGADTAISLHELRPLQPLCRHERELRRQKLWGKANLDTQLIGVDVICRFRVHQAGEAGYRACLCRPERPPPPHSSGDQTAAMADISSPTPCPPG